MVSQLRFSAFRRRPVQPTCLRFAGGLSSLLWSLWSYTVRTHCSELKQHGVKEAITQNKTRTVNLSSIFIRLLIDSRREARRLSDWRKENVDRSIIISDFTKFMEDNKLLQLFSVSVSECNTVSCFQYGCTFDFYRSSPRRFQAWKSSEFRFRTQREQRVILKNTTVPLVNCLLMFTLKFKPTEAR